VQRDRNEPRMPSFAHLIQSIPPRPAPQTVVVRIVLALALLLAANAPAAASTPRPRTCLVLSGGGARGITHIGVLRVLEEMRIPVDCIVGTSAGAIIGGVYASGASPDEIEHAIRGADWDLLLSDRPTRAERSVYARELDREHLGGPEVGQQSASVLLPRAVVSGQALQAFLHELVSPAGRGPFDALPIPYRALATDFESGRLVVLSDGDLATAIRASMSVPGAFAPVEIDGRILVDGGLVRNIGVDIARELGAERLIVVNVGTPLYRREEINSFLSAAEQMLNILAEQNVGASLAQLRPGDVLIEPQLGGFSATEFAHGVDHVREGELATRARELSLAPFAVDAQEYEAWRQRHRVARTPRRYDNVVVDTSTLRHVPAAWVGRLVGPPPLDADTTIHRLLATDDFETISAHLEPSESGDSLLLRPIEKPWGPTYLHGAVVLDSDLSGNSDFTLLLDQRMTWLTPSGLEWRNRASLGHRNSFATELREPLDAQRRFYVAPRAIVDERVRSVYTDGTAIASYRLRDLRGGVDFGAVLGDVGEVRIGLETGRSDASRVIGSPLLPDLHEHVTAWRGSLTIDRLDSLDFPRSGYLVAADAQFARRLLGGDQRYDRVTLDAQRAFGGQLWSLLLAARVQTALGSVLPPSQAFSLGGFQNLSGYRADQLLANRVDFLRAVYRHKVASFSALVPALYAGFSLEGADVSRPLDTSRANRVFGGSLFVAADSALGPIYLGTGIAEGGYVSVYFYVGRP
jgi:NTE family protein